MASSASDGTHERSAFRLSPPVLSGAMGPFMHTGLYVAQSWRDYLGQQPDKLPIARPTIALAAQAFRDEIVLLGLKARRPVSNHRVFERISQEVAAGLEFMGIADGWRSLADFLPSPHRSPRSRSERSRTADAPFIASSSTVGLRRIRVNRAANGGSHTLRTIASTPCYCGTQSRVPGWFVYTAPRWAGPRWISRCSAPGSCMTNSA